MINKVDLTDDELSLIMTSLKLTLLGHEKYLQTTGAKEAINGIKELHERLNKEYFQ